MGKDNQIEAAQILSISEHLNEMFTAYRTVIPFKVEPTKQMLDTWFEGGSKDTSGMAVHEGQRTRYLAWWLGRIENTLDNYGFAVGKQLSLADVLLYSNLADSLQPKEIKKGTAWYRTVPFCDLARTQAAVAKHPKIKASCDVVANNANIRKWLSMRGVQEF